ADTDVCIDGAAFYLRVDGDHTTEAVEQWSTGVAVVYGGIGLDRVRDRHSVRRVDVAPERADDPGGHRPLEPEGVSDREDRVSDLDSRRITERERVESRGRCSYPQHGKVARRVGADDLGRVGSAAAEAHTDVRRALDNVVVGHNVAARVDHKAGPKRADLLFPAWHEDRRR